jgi:hypothetical protein
VAENNGTRGRSPRDLQAFIEAERTGKPFIHWLDGNGEQRILFLDPGLGRLTIGRVEQSAVALTWDDEVSRTHAELEPVDNGWALVDDGLSRNGTFVNGDRVRGRRRLRDRDRMCFGNTRVGYHEAADDPENPSTKRAADGPAIVPITETQRKVLIELSRPVFEATSSTPATNPLIALELSMTVDAVKANLHDLYERFGLSELPQNEKRARLVSIVLSQKILAPHDF